MKGPLVLWRAANCDIASQVLFMWPPPGAPVCILIAELKVTREADMPGAGEEGLDSVSPTF